MTPTYRIVKFSPTPEFIDPVNVAILVQNGSTTLHYDTAFTRLNCVAPDFDKDLLAFVLADLESRVREEPASLPPEGIDFQSSQLSFSKPVEIKAPLSEDLILSLKNSYLRPVRFKKDDDNGHHDKYIETQLHDFLCEGVGISSHWITGRRALPHEYLTPASVQLLGDDNIRVKRVIKGYSGLLLIDALDLAKGHQTAVSKKADDIEYTYYRFKRKKEEIERIERRRISCAAVLFSMQAAVQKPRLEYVVDKIDKGSDLLVNPASSDSVAKLHAIAQEAMAR